jgi:hypothetical protein
MKTLLEFILEQQEKRPLYQRMLPAIKYKDGHVARGTRTDEHEDVRRKMEHKYDPRDGEAGFWHPDKKEFISREEASKYAPRGGYADSSSFRTADEKERTKEKVKRRSGFRTASAGSMSSADRLGSSYNFISAHRASKYGAKNEFQFGEGKEDPAISFRKKVDAKRLVPTRSGSKGGNLDEGNPLSRVATSNKHSITMSAERKGLTPKENADRMQKLKKGWRERGYGFRKVEGKWDEGGGVGRENSIHIFAKSGSKEHAAELLKHAKDLGAEHNQDAVLHRSPGGKGTAVYTSDTSYGKKKGDKDSYGSTRYNVDNPYGETQFKPRRPEKDRPKLTFKPKGD